MIDKFPRNFQDFVRWIDIFPRNLWEISGSNEICALDGSKFPRNLCAAVVSRYSEFRFLPFCPEYFLMGRVRQTLLSKNFAVIRCLVFLSICRLCGGCFAIFYG